MMFITTVFTEVNIMELNANLLQNARKFKDSRIVQYVSPFFPVKI